MNGDSLSLAAPKFTVGTWDRLTTEQQRIFISYVRANFGSEVGADPSAFATGLWNDSVITANSNSTPVYSQGGTQDALLCTWRRDTDR